MSIYEFDKIYHLEDLIKQDIITVMRNLYRRNLISALSGNLSVRIPGTNYIWITPSGLHKAELKVDDLVKIDLDGNIIEGHHKPSSEWRFHVAIYKLRSDIYAVAHTHNPAVLVLDLLDIKLDPSILIESKYYIKGIAYVPEAEPGSMELARYVAEVVKSDVNAIILRRHGVVTMGKNIYEAETIAEALEDLALVQLYTLTLRSLLSISK
ncbi:MAG: class II aldolase/adducin family protein [Desulfurococcaceae archaeon]|jgi:L-fuculose-phosphate aldolase|nr:class II aldolase/adducin family protein [Desulfurococcaceae archaeon]